MKLLVTGGSGFIGSNLIRHIINNSENELDIDEACRIYLDAFLNEGKGEDIG